jgi:group I intron endonuclease
MSKESGIYIIKNVINNKVYIGSAVNIKKRIYEHEWALSRDCHYNKYLQRSWKIHGKNSFIFEKCLICKVDDLIFFEQLVIDSIIFSNGKDNVYNISPTAGSTLGRKHTEETKIKIGLKSKDRWTGKHHTEETKEKIRLGNIGINLGRKHTDEARKKMSESHRGIKFSDEHRKKISESLKKYCNKKYGKN